MTETSLTDHVPQHTSAAPVTALSALGQKVFAWAPSRRSVIAGAVAASSAVCLLAGLAVNHAHVDVTIEVNGVSRPFSTFAADVDAVLANAGVHIRSVDKVAPARNSTVSDGMTIVVRHAQTLDVDINGKTTSITTTARSVQDVLKELSSYGSVQAAANRSQERDILLPLLTHEQDVMVYFGDKTQSVRLLPGQDIRKRLIAEGIPIAPLDRVRARIENGHFTIDVQTVVRGLVKTTEAIDFTERTEQSDQYFVGESVVSHPGVKGVKTIDLWQESINGQVVHSSRLAESVTAAAQEQIRLTGSKPVSPLELMKAGIDPQAKLEDVIESNGTTSKRFRAPLGSLSSDDEIAALRVEADLAGIPLVYSGEDPRSIARPLVEGYGWGDDQFRCLVALWDRESRWNPYALNSSSGAYGIPQSLPGNKMASAGADWQTNPATQIKWGLGYISGRYGSPCNAWGHSEAVGWY